MISLSGPTNCFPIAIAMLRIREDLALGAAVIVGKRIGFTRSRLNFKLDLVYFLCWWHSDLIKF